MTVQGSRQQEQDSKPAPHVAVDELNLAEFPLATVSDRFLDGTKTVVFEDTVWDYKKKQRLSRNLTLSGSDRYGLPTAKDDDVLLACIQVSSLGNFASRKVNFSRYELLKLLRWKDQTRNYRRVAASLRRWKGLTVFSDRAFYDKTRESWVNKDFGVFDNLYVYERECEEGRDAPASSWFVWNEVLFSSFQAGYLKRLNWDLYCRLESPVAKRLYRFLDKRFYHSKAVEIDLEELALRKVRMSSSYNTGQMKRGLLAGIRELESQWILKPLGDKKRFSKASRGKWTVRFEQRRRRVAGAPVIPRLDLAALEVELTRRGIGPAAAEELVAAHDTAAIQNMTELYDWYNARGQSRGAGFLVHAIKNAEQIVLPSGFESTSERKERQQAQESQQNAAKAAAEHREEQQLAAAQARSEVFLDFWHAMDEQQQQTFEEQAVKQAERLKQQGYYRAMGKDDRLFEEYRHTILRDHFERRAAA